ncbi:MAG TPA: hypothetical protein VFB63_28270 [Bryobacteraceae bacterium]|nr:hypothetical protein [Bryobacteraceae bacterium]
MIVGDAASVLPGVSDMVDDFLDADGVLDLCENEGAGPTHSAGVASHDIEVGADGLGEIGFIDDKQVTLRDARAAFARNFVATRNVDNLDGEVGELAAEARGEIVAAGFDEEQVGVELAMEFFQGEQVGGDVLANGRVGAAAGFDGFDTFRWKCFVANKELSVFAGKDVIGYRGDVKHIAEAPAELEHQRGFATANRTPHTHGKGAACEIAIVQGLLAFFELAGRGHPVVQVNVSVPVRAVVVGVVLNAHN